jgi:hypothetical protein
MKSIEVYWPPFGFITVAYTKQDGVRNVEGVYTNGDDFKDLITPQALEQVRNLMEQEIEAELSDDPEWEGAE